MKSYTSNEKKACGDLLVFRDCVTQGKKTSTICLDIIGLVKEETYGNFLQAIYKMECEGNDISLFANTNAALYDSFVNYAKNVGFKSEIHVNSLKENSVYADGADCHCVISDTIENGVLFLETSRISDNTVKEIEERLLEVIG